MKKLRLAAAVLAASVAGTAAQAYEIKINGVSVYNDTTVVTAVTTQQSATQLLITTDPSLPISTGGVTPPPVNVAPQITSGANFSRSENVTSVGTIVVSDPGDTVAYSLTGGADQSLFQISSAGLLSFNSAPDFETPADVGGDNIYNVQVTVTDTSIATAQQDVVVTVTDVNEAPAGSCPTVAGTDIKYGFNPESPGGEIVLPLKDDVTISMPFTTSSSTAHEGRFSFTNTTGYATVSKQMWVTACPEYAGEAPISSRCTVLGSTSGSINYTQNPSGSWRDCKLNPSTTYYLNIRNLNCPDSQCAVKRALSVK